MWIDTHAHLGATAFADELETVMARAEGAGIERVICVADDVQASLRAIALSERYPALSATAGIHPHEAAKVTPNHLEQLQRILDVHPVVAVGEIGLDYHYDFAPVAVQEQVFREQIRLAKDFRLPVVIHSRKAEGDVLRILHEEGAGDVGGVLHCFWGDDEALTRTLDLGFHIGVGGPVTFKNADDLRRTLRKAPLERLIVETDSPYLAPVPYRGKRNEPAFVAEVGRALAELFGVSAEEMASVTSANAGRLFRLDGTGTPG